MTINNLLTYLKAHDIKIIKSTNNRITVACLDSVGNYHQSEIKASYKAVRDYLGY